MILQSMLLATIGISVVTIACILIGSLAVTRKGPYFQGLSAALVAYFVVLFVVSFSQAVLTSLPFLLFIVFLPSVVEESARMHFAVQIRASLADKQNWLAFALGYALLEPLAKLMDLLFIVASGEAPAVHLILPVVPFALHMFLGVGVCFLLWRGWTPLQSFAAAAAVHALHNLSVGQLVVPNSEVPLFVLVRTAIFVGLTMGLFRLAERLEPVTSAPAHANTQPHD